MSPLVSSGCGDDAIAANIIINVELQETTMTVTATWSYSVDATGWTMADEWVTQRQSGGNNWFENGVSANQTAVFTVPRATTSDAVGEFCVTPVRTEPLPDRGAQQCATFNVPMQGLPSPQIDSITIEVAHAGGLARVDNVLITYDTTGAVPAGDTLWRYYAVWAADTVLLQTEMASDPDRGLQLYGILWENGRKAYCSLDPCFGIPPIPEDVGYLPEPRPLQMASLRAFGD